MQQQRSKAIWIVAILVAFFFFIDPFRLFTGGRIPTVRESRETQTELANYLASAEPAADTVLDLLRTSDVVLIGESGYAREQIMFAADLIPVLDSAGVRNLGYQYANREDQALIDQLVTATTFDEQLARRILFDHLCVLGYQEHVEVFRSAWEVNRRKGSSDEPFRIVGLSNRLDYEVFTNQDDLKDPAVMAQVFATGIPDVVIAETIATEFLERNVKAVAYMQMDHAFTGLQRPSYEEELAAIGFGGTRRAGNALRDEYGNRVVSAALHGPVRDSRSRIGYGYPAGGVIDRAIPTDGGQGRTVGFVTADSPFADVRVYGDAVPADTEGGVTLRDYADAYLIVAPIDSLTGLTPIADFITEENREQAIRTFPGVSPEGASVEDLNEFIAGNAKSIADVFRKF